MNKRIKKKISMRGGYRKYKTWKKELERMIKDNMEYLEYLKRTKTDEEKYWDEFWKDFIG